MTTCESVVGLFLWRPEWWMWQQMRQMMPSFYPADFLNKVVRAAGCKMHAVFGHFLKSAAIKASDYPIKMTNSLSSLESLKADPAEAWIKSDMAVMCAQKS